MNELDVVIVGLGPTGATLANFLGLAGLRVAVLEREVDVYALARAVHFDDEAMRVFQTLGLAEAMEEHVTWFPGTEFWNADGETLAEWPREKVPSPQGWYASYRFYQPFLEQTLRGGLDRFPSVSVHLGMEAVAVEERPDHGLVTARSIDGDEVLELRARWVVGCDGARSIVRKAMGASLDDLGQHERWLIIDLALDHPIDSLPPRSVQLCDPARPGTLINMIGLRRRWEWMIMEGDDPAELSTPAGVWKLVERWIDSEHATIERAVVYEFHSMLADRWRGGPLLLAGDAAHLMPPFMGQGMCSGIRDAANLAWKLVVIAHGQADEAILESYQSERAPHVRTFIELANALGRIIQTTDPDVARERDRDLVAVRGGAPVGPPWSELTKKPHLGPGLHDDGAPAGTLAPQPLVDRDCRLDDVVGWRFTLIADDELAGWARVASPEGLVVLEASRSADLADSLHEMGARAVLIRPDRYVAGIARDATELADLLRRRFIASPT